MFKFTLIYCDFSLDLRLNPKTKKTYFNHREIKKALHS